MLAAAAMSERAEMTSSILGRASEPRVASWRPIVSLRARIARRRVDLGAALAAATVIMAGQVRAGGSVEDGFASAARSVDGPVGVACKGLAERLALGEPFGEALDRWSDEIATPDAILLAATLLMHRRAGGSLAPILDELARTIRDRLEVDADLRALTAQGRMSAWIVGSLPVGFLMFLTLLSGPTFLATFTTPLGAILLIAGGGLEIGAVVWMRRILEVRA